jgi:inhibitor of cysteine peptidase
MILQSLRFGARLVQITLLTVLILPVTSGCGAFKKASDTAAITPAGIQLNGMLTFSKADNNRTAELRVGERFTISLPENRNAGYSWAIDETNSRMLALENTHYTEPTEGFINARGQRTFTFHCRQVGESALKLKYWRFTDGDASITEWYSLTVKIAP